MKPFNTLKAHTLPGLLHVDTLPENVRRILGKFPEGDAHLYIPGAQIPVLGPELVTTPSVTFTNAAVAANVTVGSASGLDGKTVLVTYTVNVTAGSVRGLVYGETCNKETSSKTVSGTYSETITVNGTGGSAKNCIKVQANAANTTATLDNISVREVLSYTDRISNFSAGNFRDTAGSDYANTKVDQTVGRVNDAARGLGPELYSDAVGWTALAGWVPSGRSFVASAAAAGAAIYTSSLRMLYPNKTYLVTYEISNYSAGTIGLSSAANGYTGVTRSGNGRYSEQIKPTLDAAGGIVFNPGTAFSGTVTLLSVREVIGTHAQQTTTNYQPTLRRGVVNLLTYSQDFTNAVWGGVRRTFALDSEPSSTGGPMWRVTSDGSANTHAMTTAIATTTGITYSFSVEAKAGSARYLRILLPSASFSAQPTVSFDLQSGMVNSQSADTVAASITPLGNGRYRCAMTALATSTASAAVLILYLSDNPSGPSTAATVLDMLMSNVQMNVGGIAAYSPTTNKAASNPDAGLYAWEFDGADDYLKLDSVPFGMADDHCVIAGVKCTSLTNSMAIFDQRSSSSTNPVVCKLAILPTTGTLTVQWRDDTGTTLVSPNAGSCVIGESFVFTGRKIGNVKGCRKNGGVYYVDPTPLGTATINSASIGATAHSSLTMFFAGNVYIVIAIKGAVSDADLLTLEKWVGKMSGVTI